MAPAFTPDVTPAKNPTEYSTVGRPGYKPPKDKKPQFGNLPKGTYGFTPGGYPYSWLGDVLPKDTRPDFIQNIDNTQTTIQSGVAGTVTGINDFLGKLSNVYLWKRIGVVAIGVLLIWYGVLLFLSTNKKVQGALEDSAKKVISKTPEGAAANVATGSIGL